jgi:hypothetical protein
MQSKDHDCPSVSISIGRCAECEKLDLLAVSHPLQDFKFIACMSGVPDNIGSACVYRVRTFCCAQPK